MEEEKASGLAIGALVCGILGCLGCGGCFTQIAAIILGKMEMNKIDAGESTEAGRTFAKTGMILGIVGTVIYLLAMVGYGIFFAVTQLA
jgi:hypothetical protein